MDSGVNLVPGEMHNFIFKKKRVFFLMGWLFKFDFKIMFAFMFI